MTSCISYWWRILALFWLIFLLYLLPPFVARSGRGGARGYEVNRHRTHANQRNRSAITRVQKYSVHLWLRYSVFLQHCFLGPTATIHSRPRCPGDLKRRGNPYPLRCSLNDADGVSSHQPPTIHMEEEPPRASIGEMRKTAGILSAV
ncbi:hypothetical protein QBC35DRAFT_152054 [Podospora australis]|uniref:Uncharacterized protein n=1 Tax=Podospora australis TaxID=1536484 RepID=A0AAN6WWZ1_9PEZI|nr:hypothetical protein QBC35DRAFT_152054 [Podospora australis]